MSNNIRKLRARSELRLLVEKIRIEKATIKRLTKENELILRTFFRLKNKFSKLVKEINNESKTKKEITVHLEKKENNN